MHDSNTTTEHCDWEFYTQNGLSPVINVCGTMTGLGASRCVPEAVQATASIMPFFVDMHELQCRASEVIVELTGAEAGFITASTAAGLSLTVAGCMTGLNAGLVEQIPNTGIPKNRVLIQLGHLCHYGAAIEQAVALTGAEVVGVGQSTQVLDHQLESSIDDRTSAAIYVVSHHVVEYGQIPLQRFCEICHVKNIPVIVDAASEYDLTGFLQMGADLVIYSAHKFLGGPTGGIIAGRRDLVKAAYLQNIGIGRGMKVGKESIFGAMAALKAWSRRDHAAIRAKEYEALKLWKEAASGFVGIVASIQPDPTHNPLDRLKLAVEPSLAGASAAAVSNAFAAHNPPIVVRDHEVELGYLQLDPCNLAPGQAQIVEIALQEILTRAASQKLEEPDLNAQRNRGVQSYLEWNSR